MQMIPSLIINNSQTDPFMFPICGRLFQIVAFGKLCILSMSNKRGSIHPNPNNLLLYKYDLLIIAIIHLKNNTLLSGVIYAIVIATKTSVNSAVLILSKPVQHSLSPTNISAAIHCCSTQTSLVIYA